MTAIRPYFKLGIADLESMFEAAPTDSHVCQALVDELRHRSTDRSAALLFKIERTLSASVRHTFPLPTKAVPIEPAQLTQTPITPAPAPAPAPAPKPNHAVPTVANQPSSIVAAWVALEALSPQTYRRPADLANGDARCVVDLDGDNLPWIFGERSRPKHQLYYQVVLGCIPVDRATDELIKAFGEDEEPGRREREKAAIAAILVDRNGFVLEENSVAVSSFAWALPIALKGELTGLGAWSTAEKDLVDGLTKQLTRTDRDGNPRPLDRSIIQQGFQWLVVNLGLPANLYEEPSIILRVFHYFKSKNPPEVALLNSFFLADLARASKLVEGNCAGKALSRYIGAERVVRSQNLLANHSAIEGLVAPGKIPPARWPAPGGHPLVTLQQAAVNAARSELASDGAGIVAVNGPPGTGKTTLLRDIVAACVLDRAVSMASFDDPLTAFTTTGQKVAAGDRAFLHFYRLDDSLKGHEVLVASSNNKAVENVSKELPSLKAVGRDLRYFRAVSDRLLATRSEDGSLADGEPTWGLVAAVLGNALNRNAFQQAVWWDDDRSLRLYLKAAKGDSVVREVTDEAGKVIRREVPSIIEDECPPTPEAARINWKKERSTFKALHAEVETELRKLEALRKTCLQLAPSRQALLVARAEVENADATRETRLNGRAAALRAREAAAGFAQAATRLEQQSFSERPGWLSRLFNTRRHKHWRKVHMPIAASTAEAARRLTNTMTDYESAERLLHQAEATVNLSSEKVFSCESALASLERLVEQGRRLLGVRLVDERFFEQGHERWNLESPWVPDALHRKREDLFAAALNLHRAFIDVAAQKISHNIGILMGAMYAGAFQDDAKKSLLGDLWATLFLVVPAVSTTFASMDRMLGDLPPSSIGWVLVDEAGQATPQSAVGALMRAKKAIIVGDPLQIPPVVTLPQRLVLEVAKYFGVSPAEWLAPEASVQTVADEASRLRAEFRADIGVREVGLPLLVHRRCQEPMFGISNRIAYDGQMVHAAGEVAPGPVVQALGSSIWIDVDGVADSKWCDAEGEVVIGLLSRLAAAGVKQPDIYVITPFRIVAQELRRRLDRERALFQRFEVDQNDWLRNRVGTIHTFQGKEAEAVIAVLGAPMAVQHGARRWACATPNILNVMVSRAKQALYVVGSRAAWSSVGHGKTVSAYLPTKRA